MTHLTLWLEKLISSGWCDKLSPTVAGKRQDVTPRVRIFLLTSEIFSLFLVKLLFRSQLKEQFWAVDLFVTPRITGHRIGKHGRHMISSGWCDKLSPTVAGKRQDVTPRVRIFLLTSEIFSLFLVKLLFRSQLKEQFWAVDLFVTPRITGHRIGKHGRLCIFLLFLRGKWIRSQIRWVTVQFSIQDLSRNQFDVFEILLIQSAWKFAAGIS